MLNFLKNKKVLIALAIILFLFLIFLMYYIFQSRPSDEKNAQDRLKGPTIVPSAASKRKRLLLPIKENDPRLWVDENGNPIYSDDRED